MALFPVGPNPQISNGHISGAGRPIDFVFDPSGGIFGDGGSNGPTSGWTKSKITAVSRLE